MTLFSWLAVILLVLWIEVACVFIVIREKIRRHRKDRSQK